MNEKETLAFWQASFFMPKILHRGEQMDGYIGRLKKCGFIDDIELYIHILALYYDDRREWA